MFRSILLSTAALAALSVAASAADLPARKTAPAPYAAAPLFTWTGFYVGGQLGGAWTRDSIATLGTVAAGTINGSSLIGGVHAGYNQQFGSIVLGLEADGELANASKTAIIGTTQTDRLQGQGSIRGRLGYAIDNALIYGTGGLAIANFRTAYPVSGLTASSTRTGWTLGAGIEYALTRNWTARVEYRYADFGNATDVGAPLGGAVTSARHSLTEQAVRVGVSYKFDMMGGPVVAKY